MAVHPLAKAGNRPGHDRLASLQFSEWLKGGVAAQLNTRIHNLGNASGIKIGCHVLVLVCAATVSSLDAQASDISRRRQKCFQCRLGDISIAYVLRIELSAHPICDLSLIVGRIGIFLDLLGFLLRAGANRKRNECCRPTSHRGSNGIVRDDHALISEAAIASAFVDRTGPSLHRNLRADAPARAWVGWS
jgi:hypothetical protein